MKGNKLILLLRSAKRRDGEFTDRLRALFERSLDRFFVREGHYDRMPLNLALNILSDAIGDDLSEFTAEESCTTLTRDIEMAIRGLLPNSTFTTRHNADLGLARLVYALCRGLRPRVVVETGVAYGVGTAFILQALRRNGRGHLHSIDLPPLADRAESHIGSLIPEPLMTRWHLYRGSSRRVLPQLLSRHGPVDIFFHDSLHTYSNMTSEFRAVLPHLAARSALVADDVDHNSAFQQLVDESTPSHSLVVAEENKCSSFGVCVYQEHFGSRRGVGHAG